MSFVLTYAMFLFGKGFLEKNAAHRASLVSGRDDTSNNHAGRGITGHCKPTTSFAPSGLLPLNPFLFSSQVLRRVQRAEMRPQACKTVQVVHPARPRRSEKRLLSRGRQPRSRGVCRFSICAQVVVVVVHKTALKPAKQSTTTGYGSYEQMS